MTQTEFIKKYFEKSKMTEKEGNKLGLFCVPCDCQEDDCEKWAMMTRENLLSHCGLYVEL
jgi:hypothetical protein